MNSTLFSLITATSLMLSAFQPQSVPKALAEVTYSLSNRYSNSFVNGVFSDNILLTLAYLGRTVKNGNPVDWKSVKDQKETSFVLKPGETFAFHEAVLDKYKGKIALTTNAHFNASEGFKSDGWLVGDGVCHLASFMYVAAQRAGLDVEAPTSHDFAVIPNIEKKDGVSIYSENTLQNLYITNTKQVSISFVFVHTNNDLTIRIEEVI